MAVLRTTDELDSFMFQTVGHEGVALFAEAMSVPLFCGVTSGCSHAREKTYVPHPGDEVEDLYRLLARVKVRSRVTVKSWGECRWFSLSSSSALLLSLLTRKRWRLRVWLVELSYQTTND